MCMPLKLATTRDCGGGVQFNAGIDSRVAKRILTTPFKLVLLNS